MALLASHLLFYLLLWTSGVAGFAFTNSFDNWVGNTTYRIDWTTSSSDPSTYDLELVQPLNIYSIGITPNLSWPDRWSHKYAVQIPINGDHFIQVSLGSDVWPGAYYWRILGPNQAISASNTFLISSSGGRTNPTTVSSFIPVTATQDITRTSDGHLVTYKSSDVYSSAIVYTTIIVVSDGGKGTPLTKIPMIIGITLALVFLITLPVILWLLLRYRRRPSQSSGADKPVPIDMELEDAHNSSVLDLIPSSASAVSSTVGSAPTRTATQQVWAIIDGEKRLVTIPRDPPHPMPPVVDSDPFADPSTPIKPKSHHRILIPTNPSTGDHSPSINLNPNDPLLTRTNTSTSAAFSREIDTHTGSVLSGERLGEKMPQPSRQGSYLEPYVLSEEEIASRMIIPGRAVDMGPLGRDHVQDIDENGLLPPDYFQATQPLSPRHSSQAGPSNL
ncbi:hypothetical protein OPQ81_000905 [Rhizoctonia solani]|nr:hypothetical protein OPQ81_000905 [Rhizoctonia solani]